MVTSFELLDELIPRSDGKGQWRILPRVVFDNDANGSSPVGALVLRDGALYGVTSGAGSGPAPYGTIYAYSP